MTKDDETYVLANGRVIDLKFLALTWCHVRYHPRRLFRRMRSSACRFSSG